MTTRTDRSMAQVLPTVHGKLALGCWAFGGAGWGGQDDEDSMAAMQAALDAGITHFDTAMAYGNGRSERLVGQFIAGKQDRVFVATKGNTPDASPEQILDSLERSRQNLGVDAIDLFYLHWPRRGKDMKPVMAAIEEARQAGKVKAIGVSNFSVRLLQDVASVCQIDTHQLCLNPYWRRDEADVIPYCQEHGIAVVTYSSIAQGILTGKFGQDRPVFPKGDARAKMVMFDEEVWPHVHAGTERMKRLAEREQQPLVNLAIQWVASRPGVSSVLLGARNAEQARENAVALSQTVADATLDELTAISDEVLRHLPDADNIFRFNPA